MSEEVLILKNAVDQINRQLSIQSDLSPNNHVVNQALSSLVKIVTSAPTCTGIGAVMSQMSSSGALENLRSIAQQAEYLLEHYYATNLLQS